MSLIGKKLPVFAFDGDPAALRWDAPDDVMQKWLALAPVAREDSETIDIFDIIGDDFFGEGVNDKQIARALGQRRGQEVKVRVNSPGGDVFAGLSIYNLLRSHNAKVTVEVTGIAASAASIIAMAADEIVMAEGSMMMIHNAWGLVVGNQHDLLDASMLLAKIDDQLIGIYSARTGMDEEEVADMMKAETFLKHDEAVDMGFADKVDSAQKVSASMTKTDTHPVKEKRRLERALGRIGVPRNKRPEIISLIVDEDAPRDASVQPAARDAGTQAESVQFMSDLLNSLKAL